MMFNVVLCGDKNVEVGLHVTLYSLLKNTESFVHIYLILKKYTEDDIAKIYDTLLIFQGQHKLTIIDFNELPLFAKFKGLHGSKFNFTKLMIADLISNEDKILYLDTDLIIETDLSQLFLLESDCVIGAVSIETISDSLKSKFYQSIGMSSHAPYFNSGVMLMNLKLWRDGNFTELCLNFANKYVDRVAFGDELILNCIFYQNFKILDPMYNRPVYPSDRRLNIIQSKGILHFVGSPKPWDLGGEYIHSNYSFFNAVLELTAFKKYRSWQSFSIIKLKRTLNLVNSYIRCIQKRYYRDINTDLFVVKSDI